MADNKVTIEIAVEGNAQVQFKKLSDSAAEFAAETKKSFLDTGRIFDNFIANLGSSAVAAGINILKNGFAAVNSVLADSIKAAIEQEDAINKLNTALKSTGQFSQATSKDLQEFAAQLQATTKYADENIESAIGLIATLGRLHGDTLKQATTAALNLSAALGIDLQSAANLVGKAADGNVSVLSRYGIQVKETGDKVKDFAKALVELNDKFGGAAASQVNTFSGALAQLKNQYGEVLESIGNTIIQSPAVIAAINELSKSFIQLNSHLGENKAAQEAIKNILLFLVDTFYVAVKVTQELAVFFLNLGQSMIALQAIALKVTDQMTFGLAGTAKSAEAAKEQAYGLKEAIAGIENSETINEITKSISEMRVAIQESTIATQEKAVVDAEVFENKKVQSEQELLMAQVEIENKAIQQEQAQANALLSLQNYLTIRNAELKKKDDELAKAEIEKNNARLAQLKVAIEANQTARLKSAKDLSDAEEKENKRREQSNADTLNSIASLSKAKTKELAAIGKAAAIAQATISTYTGASNALKDVPFPFNFVAAAAVIAAGLVNVSNIIGTPLATGITQVPAGFQNDTFPARLSSGERVVSAPQNRDLTEFLAGSSGLSERLDQLIAVLSLNSGRTTVMIGGREVIGAIQEELDSGRQLNV